MYALLPKYIVNDCRNDMMKMRVNRNLIVTNFLISGRIWIYPKRWNAWTMIDEVIIPSAVTITGYLNSNSVIIVLFVIINKGPTTINNEHEKRTLGVQNDVELSSAK